LPERIVQWQEEDNAIARAAREIMAKRERLIGLKDGPSTGYPGVREHLLCQTEEPEAVENLAISSLEATVRKPVQEYISAYNRLISGYWETARNSCGN